LKETNLIKLYVKQQIKNKKSSVSLWTVHVHKHIDVSEHDLAYYPDLFHQPWASNVIFAWSWRLRGINPSIH
jgi:hypothetical protein